MGWQFVLFGTGDWGNWADPIFDSVADDYPKALVIAAGQLENGLEAVNHYTAGAAQRLARVGVEMLDVAVVTRADADSDRAVRAVQAAGLVYVLGGGPRCTVDVLPAGSRLWSAIQERRLPYVGSSGGSMLLGRWYPASVELAETVPALGLFPWTVLAADWDELDDMSPGLRDRFARLSQHLTLVGLDRNAGLRGDGRHWEVVGTATVTVRDPRGEWTTYSPGQHIALDLLPGREVD